MDHVQPIDRACKWTRTLECGVQIISPCGYVYCLIVQHCSYGTIRCIYLMHAKLLYQLAQLKRPARTSSESCLRHLGWLTLFQHRCIALVWHFHKCYLQLAPTYLSSKFLTNCQFGYSHTCGSDSFHLSSPKATFRRNSSTFRGLPFTIVYLSLFADSTAVLPSSKPVPRIS